MGSQKWKNVLLIGTILLSLLLAYSRWFTYDDAYISFKYAYNLIHGKELVYNPGERVEGYTNFLWVILVSVGMKIGISPETFTLILGLISAALTLLLTFKITKYITNSWWISWAMTLITGLNHTFLFATVIGLETLMQTFWLTLSIYYLVKMMKVGLIQRYIFIVSIAHSIAILLHPDSVVFTPIALGVIIYLLKTENISYKESKFLKTILLYIIPITLLIAPWIVWKVWYYGTLLPNTYYAKSKGITGLVGIYYIVIFLLSYFLLPEIFIIIFLFIKNIKKKVLDNQVFLVFSTIFLWFLYIIKVDGDFIDFRFMVPIMPILFSAIGWCLTKVITQNIVRTSLILSLIIGNIYRTCAEYEIRMGSGDKKLLQKYPGILSLPTAKLEQIRWIKVGKKLFCYFKGDSTITIATSAAGAIPYYSKLKNIDILGLNDKWIAKNAPYRKWASAAHRTKAPISYLIKRKVNLLIEHPRVISVKSLNDLKNAAHSLLFSGGMKYLHMDQPFPNSAEILAIPVEKDSVLFTIYLTPHPKIDSLITANKWLHFLINTDSTSAKTSKDVTSQSQFPHSS